MAAPADRVAPADKAVQDAVGADKGAAGVVRMTGPALVPAAARMDLATIWAAGRRGVNARTPTFKSAIAEAFVHGWHVPVFAKGRATLLDADLVQ